jgi:hypothetical protein
MSKRRTIRLMFYGMLALLLLFESSSLMFARKAALRAQKVVSLLGSFRPGGTNRADVENQFKTIGVGLEDLPCSGDGCQGLGIAITNYPRFTLSEKVAVDLLLAQASIVRPSAISVDFYFDNNRLQQMLLTYHGHEPTVGDHDPTVRISRHFSNDLNRSISRWLILGNKGVKIIEVSSLENERSPRSTLAESLDLACLDSVRGCRTALQLWPAAPAATAPWGRTRPE